MDTYSGRNMGTTASLTSRRTSVSRGRSRWPATRRVSARLYEAFFELWKRAHPDVPLLLQAKAGAREVEQALQLGSASARQQRARIGPADQVLLLERIGLEIVQLVHPLELAVWMYLAIRPHRRVAHVRTRGKTVSL